MIKVCDVCKQEKDLILNFHKNRTYKDKLYYSSTCKLCTANENKIYRLKNKDIIKTRKKIYCENNKNKIKFSKEQWYLKNKKHNAAKSASWVKANPDGRKQIVHRYYLKNKLYYKLKCAERAAKLKQVTIQKFSKLEFEQRMSVFGFKCAYCNGPFEHIDHLKPLIKGGIHCLSNLRPACKKCNLSKNKKNALEWLKIVSKNKL